MRKFLWAAPLLLLVTSAVWAGSTGGHISVNPGTPPAATVTGVSSPLTLDGGIVVCPTATDAGAGCVSAADWTTFNSKQVALTGTNGVTVDGGTVDCTAASDGGAGCVNASAQAFGPGAKQFTGDLLRDPGNVGARTLISSLNGTQYPGIWFGTASPSSSNYAMLGEGNTVAVNGVSEVDLDVGNGVQAKVTSAGLAATALNINSSGVLGQSWYQAVTLDFSASSAVTPCVDSANQTITGLAVGDSCTVSVGGVPEAGANFSCYVTATDTYIIRFCGNGIVIDPASHNFRVRTFR